MTQQPFSRPGAIDLSGLKRPAPTPPPAGGGAPGGGAAAGGSSYAIDLTEENFQATIEASMTAPVLLVFFSPSRMPESAQDIPLAHIRQMAAYAAALREIFPGKVLRVSLLYTAGPRMFDIADDLLAAHKPRLGGEEHKLGVTGLETDAHAN